MLSDRFLNNRYRVIQLLGDGGFGQTFLAEDTHMPSSRLCVVKQLKPINDNPKFHQLVQERFQREAAILEALSESSTQIPKLYAYFTEADQFYLIEEWIEGDTLAQKLKKEGLLQENKVREILEQTLNVIDYIHQKTIIHRDIKPDNIILRQKDGKPVLIDFGAVKETMGTTLDSQGNSTHSIVVGTPGFMASEQLAGRPVYASDLYSLGLTAIFLLTGKLPQELATDPGTGSLLWRTHAPQVSDAMTRFLDQAIQLHPRDRFPTAREMLKALTSLEVAHPSVATTISALPLQTVPVAPAPVQSIPTQITALPQPAPQGEWKKAVIIGGLIGTSILASTLVIRTPLLEVLDNPSDNEPKETPETKATPTPSQANPSPSPTQQTPITQAPPKPIPAPAVAPQPPIPSSSLNATIVGSPGKKNIRTGPGTNYRAQHIAYPGDRVQVMDTANDSGGYRWYKIYFPRSGAQGWIAAQLLAIDGQSAPTPPRVQVQPQNTNATIIGTPGSKNIRTGPGTNYRAQHIAYPGDRVQIVGSDFDQGGYLWYKVYFPKSGAQGWIAAQLIKVD